MLDALDLSVMRAVASVHGAAYEIGVEILVGRNVETNARRVEYGARKRSRGDGVVNAFKTNEKPAAVRTHRRDANGRSPFPVTALQSCSRRKDDATRLRRVAF